MNANKNVGIWVRVSTDFQVKDESPEHHEQRGRYYAEAKDWNIVTVYRLDAMSGKSVMEYPETKRMLQDVKEGRISGLIFSKLARLARNTKELIEFAEIFKKYDCDLISLAENIDTSTPSGRFFYTIIAAQAEWERAEIADRVAASVPIRAKLGKPLGGQASFGYQWQGKQLIINENEAPIRRLIYELFLKYRRKKTVADEMTKLGYRTRNGSDFSDTTIHRLLRDSSAKGLRRANYSKSLGEGKKWDIKPESEWVYTTCPAIVSEELWDECNQLLDMQEGKRKKPGPRAVYLLSGYVSCTCGKQMYVYHSTPVFTCKACKSKITVTDIDEIYHEQLKNFLFTQNDVEGYLASSDSLVKEKETLLALAKKDAETIQKEIERLVKLRMSEELDKETFAKLFRPIEARSKQLDSQIPELEAEIDFLKIQYLSSDVVLNEAQDLYTNWASLPFEEKRSIIEVITDKIIIGKEDITINLAYFPPTPINSGKSLQKFKDS